MVIKNISFSVVIKFADAFIRISIIPLLINILGVERYGVWSTFTSLLVWVSLFDLGLGYALKNTVAQSLASGDMRKALNETINLFKIMIYTTFLLLIIFIILLYNIDAMYDHYYLSLALFIPVIITYPFTIGNSILIGSRHIALQSGLLFINISIFGIGIYAIYITQMNIDLIMLSFLFVSSYLVSLSMVWYYSIKIIPINYFEFKNIIKKSIDSSRMRVGFKFFGMQISSLVLYSIGPILIYTKLDAIHAAHFSVINKLFIFGLGIFNIAIGAFWPEISNHLEKREFKIIKKYYFFMLAITFLFILGSFAFSIISPHVINIWTNDNIHVEAKDTLYFAFLISVQAVAYSGAVVLNAYEKMNGQIILSVISTAFMVPLSLFLITKGCGLSSVPIAAGLLTIIPAIYCNIYAYKLINHDIKHG